MNPAILILDNCSAQKHFSEEEQSSLPAKLLLLYLPPNVTSHHQPCDMGIIASLKVGYKTNMLRKLLAVFDIDGGFQQAALQRARTPKGCRGLAVGGKANILDAMTILQDIWEQDDKYASEDGIRHCWRKANILPEC